jgi:hypothetical protein
MHCPTCGKVFDATRMREHFTALVGKPTASYEAFEKCYKREILAPSISDLPPLSSQVENSPRDPH